MSEQYPPGTPAEGPDPFAELLKGLIEEPTPASVETPAADAAPEPITSSADVPTVAFTPVEQPTVVPPSVEQSAITSPPLDEPTVAFSPEPVAYTPEPTAVLPEPISASGTPSAGAAPTVLLPGSFDPTAATTVLAGGAGGGLPPSEPPRGGGFRDWEPRRKALFITLISAAGLLLIAIIILLVLAIGGNKGDQPTPTTSPTGTSTPTRTPTPTPTPTPTATVKPAVQSFTVNSPNAVCADTGAGTNVTMHFAWTVVGAPTQIAIASAPATIDAIKNPFQNNLPATATDFQMPFGCNNEQLTYTLTIEAADGQHYSGVVTVVRQYTPPPPIPVPTVSATLANGPACLNSDPGTKTTVNVSWTATPDGATVDLFLAEGNTPPGPGQGGTFAPAGSGAASGSKDIEVSCDASDAGYFTVHVIASTISGTADAYLDGAVDR